MLVIATGAFLFGSGHVTEMSMVYVETDLSGPRGVGRRVVV